MNLPQNVRPIHSLKDVSNFRTNAVIQAYQQMIQSRIDLGWAPWLLTFEFQPLTGNEVARIGQIQRFLEHFYSLALTRFVRHPRRLGLLNLPMMLGMPDYPVVKNGKIKRIAINNDGLHAHAVYLVPPNSRHRPEANSVFGRSERLFHRKCYLQTLDVRPVVATPREAVKYVLKSLELRRFDQSHIWLLPKAHSEVRDVLNAVRGCDQ